jgi:hypothetical protein
MTAEEANVQLERVKQVATYNQIAADAGNEPEKWLRENSTPAAMKKNYPDSLPTYHVWGMGLAQRSRSANRYAEMETMRKMETHLWDLSMDPNTTPEQWAKAITDLPSHLYPLEVKDRLLKSGASRMALVAEGKGHPLLVRQDQAAYRDLLLRATAEPSDLTEPEVREAVNQNQITLKDYEHLVGIIRRKPSDTQRAANLKSGIEITDAILSESVNLADPQKKAAAKIQAERLLEDAMDAAAENNTPMSKRDVDNEAIRIARDLARRGLMSTVEELLPTPKDIKTKSGVKIGSYNAEKKIVLNAEGIRRLFIYGARNGWTKEQTLAFARDNDYVVNENALK